MAVWIDHLNAPFPAPIEGYLEWHSSDDLSDTLRPRTWPAGVTTFGTVHLEVPEVPMSSTPLAILVSLDRSGSMTDVCGDGRTKLEHIQHVLKNLCAMVAKYTSSGAVSVRICFLVFSHDVTNILQERYTALGSVDAGGGAAGAEAGPITLDDGFVDIVPEHLPAIYDALDHIDAWGLTNLEKSFKYVHTKMETYRASHPGHRVVHIQMTDGEATAGKKTPAELQAWVDPADQHIFVGVGDDHDSMLLNYLADRSPLGEYRFMDQLEKSGWICGEILYNLLYPFPRNADILHLRMTEGMRVYDWRTNAWTTELVLPLLAGKMEKDYHLCMEAGGVDGEATAEAAAVYICNADGTLVNILTALPPLVDVVTGERVPTDLTKYLLRQRTQECLYRVKTYETAVRDRPRLGRRMGPNRGDDGTTEGATTEGATTEDATTEGAIAVRGPDIATLHAELAQLYRELELSKEVATEDADVDFIQVLMDDVRVTQGTLGTFRGHMYTSSRMTSQGNQHSYTPTGSTMTGTMPVDWYTRNTTTYTNSSVFSMMTEVAGGEPYAVK